MVISSASLKVPFTPSKSLSLGSLGSYTADSSASKVRVTTQISTRRCQSTEDRASREASRARTTPTWPAPISASSLLNPSRWSERAPDRP